MNKDKLRCIKQQDEEKNSVDSVSYFVYFAGHATLLISLY